MTVYVREIAKFIKSKYFFITAVAVFALISDGFFTNIVAFNDGGLISAIFYITGPDKLFAAAALLIISIPCVVPITDEIESGCYRNYIFRMGKRNYFASRITATVILPIIITGIVLTLYLIGYVIVHPERMYIGQEMGGGKIFETPAVAPRLLFLISRLFFAGFFCGAWSAVSLAAAAWTNNRYIILGIAFCLDNLSQLLVNRGIIPLVFSSYDKINGYVLMRDYTILQQSMILLAYDSGIIALSAVVFSKGMKRRMECG